MENSLKFDPSLSAAPPAEPIRRWTEVQAPAAPEPEGPSGHFAGPAGLSPGRLAIWLLIASEIVIFAGLLGSFILFRMSHPEWAGETGHLNLLAGTLNTFILLTSNFFMMKASVSADGNRLGDSKRFMLYTMAMGMAFLGVKAFEYSAEFARGEFPSSGNFWSFYFLMTGVHALHILGGVLAIGLLWAKAVKGTLEPIRHRVGLTGLYWSFVEVVWVFLFPLLYLLA